MLRRSAVLLLAVLATPGRAAAEEVVDGIAAQVGNEIVLVSEVMRMAAPVETELRARGAPEHAFAQVRAEALEHMIEWRLMEKVVRDAELYASDEEIDGAIEAIASQNGISVEQLRQSVSGHGLDYEEYRGQIKREIEQRKVVGMVLGSKVRIEEEELQQLYQEHFADQPAGGTNLHLRQILIPYGEEYDRGPDVACGAARAARQRIAAGESFEQVASEVSAVAPERGGDIGWLHLDTAAPWIRDQVAPLEPGQVSDVVSLPFACALLQLVERREVEPVTYEQARPMLERQLRDQKVTEEMDTWLESLRKYTYIERKGYFADAARLEQAPADAGLPGEGSDPLLP